VFTATFLPRLLGQPRGHIILFSNGPGPEWGALFSALATHGGPWPPCVRVTMIIPFDGPTLLPQFQQGYAGLGERVRAAAESAGVALGYTQTFVRPSEYPPFPGASGPLGGSGSGEYLALHSSPTTLCCGRNPRDACLSVSAPFNLFVALCLNTFCLPLPYHPPYDLLPSFALSPAL